MINASGALITYILGQMYVTTEKYTTIIEKRKTYEREMTKTRIKWVLTSLTIPHRLRIKSVNEQLILFILK